MSERDYSVLEIVSPIHRQEDPELPEPLPQVDQPREHKCVALCKQVVYGMLKSARYMTNACALTTGAVAGAYLAVYVMTKITPITLHLAIDLPGPGPE